MKIRSHLLLLVAGGFLPLLLFATGLTAYSWWQQRVAVEQRQLDRVRAVTIALDTELQASIRVLKVLGLSPGLDPADMPAFAERMRGVMATQPLWTALAVGDPQWGQVVAVVPGGPLPYAPRLDEVARRQVLATRLPAVSALVYDGTTYLTQVAVPVLRGDEVVMVAMASIDQQSWVRFLSQYAVGPGGVLTILDQEGLIVARSLNNERWVGKAPTQRLLERSRESAESTFRNVTHEGEAVYSAHSRSIRWGWTVANAIPAATVESALFRSTLLLVGFALLSLALAGLLAWYYARRIEKPVAALGESAHALARGEEPQPAETGRIDELQDVANAFHRASAMLHERQRALNAALAGEQRARLEAEQASQAKDEFLAMLGHELRNPLNAVTSAVGLIERVEPGDARAVRAREIIQRQMGHLRGLVDDLLDVARVTRGKIDLQRVNVDLGQVVSRAVAAMASSSRLGEHPVDVHCEEAWVSGDETRLEQVVANLLDNAAKYTPPGRAIHVHVRREGEEAVLEVRDEGMGIAPDLLPRVFDLFTQGERTLDRSQGGLGLGLALVRQLVELHGGTVAVASDGPGRGASFTVRLPLHEEAPAAQRVRAGDECEKRLRILIVEDNVDGRETLAMMLSLQGHEVHEAEDGPAGVERALALHPDAAIVDIGLPGFDGYEVARRIRAAARGAAILLVALTGYGQEEDRQNAARAGFDSFLVKPADFGALSSILARV